MVCRTMQLRFFKLETVLTYAFNLGINFRHIPGGREFEEWNLRTPNQISVLELKTHIRDLSKSAAWRLIVHHQSPILFHYTISLNADWVSRASPTGKRTIWNLNDRLGPALDPKQCLLARWTRSIHIPQDSTWKGIGGVIIEDKC